MALVAKMCPPVVVAAVDRSTRIDSGNETPERYRGCFFPTTQGRGRAVLPVRGRGQRHALHGSGGTAGRVRAVAPRHYLRGNIVVIFKYGL